MRIVLQRVTSASVTVEGRTVGAIGRGYLLLVGFGKGDTESTIRPMVEKISVLRLFPDERGRFHHSILDVEGGILAVSQFTLYADTSKGRRPDFFDALEPEQARNLFDAFVETLRGVGVRTVERGEFGALMSVALENDGPVTLILES